MTRNQMDQPPFLRMPTTIHTQLDAIDLAGVPVMATDRHIPRKDQAKLARKLFSFLGIKGLSVTAPNYSMAQVVEVRMPREPHPGWAGFEQWQHATWSEIPDHVPAKAQNERRLKSRLKLEAILAVAFPAHDDRSDRQSDYFDYCWSVD